MNKCQKKLKKAIKNCKNGEILETLNLCKFHFDEISEICQILIYLIEKKSKKRTKNENKN
jgi:ketopantoate reductase